VKETTYFSCPIPLCDLTKRELFAAMAMQAMCSNDITRSSYRADGIAGAAIEQADALIAELEKGK
jgi:hypothetical protein